MRVLVTGATGQVGRALSCYAWPIGTDLVLPGRAELDLSKPDMVGDFVAAGNFDVVINPAAYTAVDNAENEPILAWKVNALAAAALAQATRNANIPVIHVSTDYVFSGAKLGPYTESDAIDPTGVYGASKAAGELAVRATNPRHVILRTSWVFSAHGNNFVKTMLRLGKDRSVIRVVDDQIGCPTSAEDIASVLATIALRLVDDGASPAGTYHFSNDGPVTWCGFAREIFRQQREAGHKVADVVAITSADYPTLARRPSNSVLSVEKLERDYGIQPRPWANALKETLAVLSEANAISTEKPQ